LHEARAPTRLIASVANPLFLPHNGEEQRALGGAAARQGRDRVAMHHQRRPGLDRALRHRDCQIDPSCASVSEASIAKINRRLGGIGQLHDEIAGVLAVARGEQVLAARTSSSLSKCFCSAAFGCGSGTGRGGASFPSWCAASWP